MRRRDFVKVIGGTVAAWPLAARAQQPVMPVIGLLSSLILSERPRIMAAFQQGLNVVGFVEGQNAVLEHRFAEGHYDRLPALAADLVRHQVAVIAAISGTPAAMAAKSATATIPIVFAMGSDPVEFGLVTSLNRPGGNVTGVTFFTAALGAKRLELLRELVSKATTIALFVNPDNPPSAADAANVQAAARSLGQQVKLLKASAGHDIDVAFETFVRERPSAIYAGPDPLFFNERNRLVALTARHAIPAIYAERETVEASGLISYGASRADAYRQAGIYVDRILKGERPGDLPVMLPTKFELAINLKTARADGLAAAGYIEGRNVAIEYRWSEGQYDRLPVLAADLVRRQVTVIVATGVTASGVAAKAATAVIPIVFATGGDPVKLGLVASLNRPGANVTGISWLSNTMAPKRLELLRELLPHAKAIGFLINPGNPNVPTETADVQVAAEALGLRVQLAKASTEDQIDNAFGAFVQAQVDAVFTGGDPFFFARRVQLAILAARYAIPLCSDSRGTVEAGGLMSYGANTVEMYRGVGLYTGRILKGEKPADLPVQQLTKFEFVINLRTAKTLGLTVPDKLLALADEAIE